MHCVRPDDGSRLWRTPDAVHVDLRGLEPPEPMVTILRMIDEGEVDTALVAHFDREPIFLYPELEDRGWAHELVSHSCGGPACEDEIQLRLTRWSR
jgi:uncharacterized protein DUF2249